MSFFARLVMPFGYLLFGSALLSGCFVSDPRLLASATLLTTHAPAHPDTNASVTLKAHSTGSVDKITLAYEVYTLSTGPGGTHVQTLTTPLTLARICDPPGSVDTLDCIHIRTEGFPANSMITLVAKAMGGDGHTRTESYSFAAGAYPWPNDPIPIRVTGDPAGRMDLVFVRDNDITPASFRADLAGVIEDLYFKYSTYRGDGVSMWRALYNFYYSGVRGDYEEPCKFTAPTNLATLQAVGDAVAILHGTELRDCKSGGLFSSEINYDKTLIHETGHAIFGLMDEYCCDSDYAQQSCLPNLYASLASCQADAPRLGLPASACTKLSKGTQSTNFWRIDSPGPDGCMMGPTAHDPGSDHGVADRRRISWRWNKCLAGRCFTTPECP